MRLPPAMRSTPRLLIATLSGVVMRRSCRWGTAPAMTQQSADARHLPSIRRVRVHSHAASGIWKRNRFSPQTSTAFFRGIEARCMLLRQARVCQHLDRGEAAVAPTGSTCDGTWTAVPGQLAVGHARVQQAARRNPQNGSKKTGCPLQAALSQGLFVRKCQHHRWRCVTVPLPKGSAHAQTYGAAFVAACQRLQPP